MAAILISPTFTGLSIVDSKAVTKGGPQAMYPMRKPPQCRPRTQMGAETSFIMTNVPALSLRRYV